MLDSPHPNLFLLANQKILSVDFKCQCQYILIHINFDMHRMLLSNDQH